MIQRTGNRHVAVIGAGLAGLAAALTLLKHGHQVCVFEAAPQAGGRARSVNHADTALDNGQHLCIGAYHATLALLRDAGVQPDQVFTRLPLALYMHDGARRMTLRTPTCLPAPLHLLWGLLGAQGLSWQSKWHAIRWMQQLKQQKFSLTSDLTVSQLLNQGQQTAQSVRTLWEPLCLAALNTPIKLASAQIFLNVLRDSFQHQRSDSDFLVVKADLSSALIHPLMQQVRTLGGEIRLHEAVSAVQPVDSACLVSTKQATQAFDQVVIAVGPHQLKTLMADLPVPAFDYEPITTIYLQYDAELKLPQPVMGLCHGQAQWLFDRGQCCGQPGLLAVVISAHARLEDSKEHFVMQCIDEINLALAAYQLTLPAPLWTKVITEKRATFRCTPDLARPKLSTSSPHLFLAGDYVDGPYPATIEGAVRSGIAAADAIHLSR